MADPEWVEAQATTHIFDWQVNERRLVNRNDPEIKALLDNDILLLVDENNEAILPPPAKPKSGCGCG